MAVPADMKLVWELRGNVSALESLLRGKTAVSRVFAVAQPLPTLIGPPVGSDEWWEGIQASEGAAPQRGRIEAVRPKAGRRGEFDALLEDGRRITDECRGGPDEYFESFQIELVRSFPPPGFVHPDSLDPEGGLLLEVWIEG